MEATETEDQLALALKTLFLDISNYKKKTGVLAPKKFMQILRQENELFQGHEQHDSHEFLNFALNHFHESAIEWIKRICVGKFVNEIVCLCCNTKTQREEEFFELSLEVKANVSLQESIQRFSSNEFMEGADKFMCDKCMSKQMAEKRIHIKQFGQLLIVHLKRFKYNEQLKRFTKLRYAVPFDDLELDCEYLLRAVVVHIGNGLNTGHYVCLVKNEKWVLLDDDYVQVVEDEYISDVFGNEKNSDAAYLLFYEKADLKKIAN